MGVIITFLSGTLGRLLVGGGIFLAAWLWIKFHYERNGAAKERARIEHAGVKNAGKAAAARRAVDAIPDDGLRDHYYRD